MKKLMVLVGILVLIALTACGGTISEDTVVATPASNEAVENVAQLNDKYENALTVQVQLALGTIILEDGSLAVDAAQAADLLPLWRAVQSMTASGTAADAEITAVLNQIQAGMTTKQIAGIADMKLTQEAMRALVQDGVITIAAGDVKRGSADEATSGARGGGPVGGQTDPAQQAARQAEDGGGNNLLNQAVTSAVVQMLELKTT